jgi:hypothetical protein
MGSLCRQSRLAKIISIIPVVRTIGRFSRSSSTSFPSFFSLSLCSSCLLKIYYALDILSILLLRFALLEGIRLPFTRLKISELYAAWQVKAAYQHSRCTKKSRSMATCLSELHTQKKKFLRINFFTKKKNLVLVSYN